MLIMFISVAALSGLHLLSALSLVFLIDFSILLGFQTNLIMQNKTTVDRALLHDENFNIYKGKTRMENWSSVFTTNIFSWLLPFGTPDALQALDYQAAVPAGGLVLSEPGTPM
mmetsp:Transcript_37098/g.48754  ORF Transcript_37098/g.48754 Transcript_37098/m.48754 type:complete len:113 (+) Transcript_37098:906-1244(+)